MGKPIAEFIEDHLVVWNLEHGKSLYEMGFFGKPLGIAKPKALDFEVPLVLDLIEGLYLLETKKIQIRNPNGKALRKKAFLEKAKKTYIGFERDYIVYKNLRNNGKVVLPGIKFGCEFAVYERGPGIDHAPYLVTVKSTEESITSIDIVRAGRLATTVRKRFIIAVPDEKTSQVRYMMFDWFRA